MKPLDQVMVCRVGRGKTATKSHELVDGKWTTENFDAGYYVQARAARVNGIGQLFALLNALASKPGCFVLRGGLRPGVDGQRGHVRRYHTLEPTADDPNPEPPSYAPVDHRWLCVDVDDFVIPEELRGARDRGAAVSMVVKGLPAWLARAGYVAQWSSSAGLDGFRLAKLHLWFWCTRPVCGFSLREHFHAWNATYDEANPAGRTRVDCALYNPVQPHYTAAPVFVGEGIVDPLKRVADVFSIANGREVKVLNDRLRWTLGDNAEPPSSVLNLADFKAREERQRQRERQRRASARAARDALGTRWGNANKRERYVTAALDAAVSNVEALHGDHEWYGELRKESFSTYGLVAAGELEQDVWRTTWEEVAGRPGGIPGRKMSLKDIKRLLDGAERRAGARDVSHVGGSSAGQESFASSKRAPSSFTSRAKSWLK